MLVSGTGTVALILKSTLLTRMLEEYAGPEIKFPYAHVGVNHLDLTLIRKSRPSIHTTPRLWYLPIAYQKQHRNVPWEVGMLFRKIRKQIIIWHNTTEQFTNMNQHICPLFLTIFFWSATSSATFSKKTKNSLMVISVLRHTDLPLLDRNKAEAMHSCGEVQRH